MSKQRERARLQSKQKQLRLRGLLAGGIVLSLIAGGIFLLLSLRSDRASPRPISRLNTDDFHSLAFSPIEPATVFFGHHGGLMVSHNGGVDWSTTTLVDADAMALGIATSDPPIIYAAGHDVLFRSSDAGGSWERVSTDLPGTDIHGFAVDPDDASHVFAHVVGFGIFESLDGGTRWTLVSNAVPPSTFNLAVGGNPKVIYAATGQAGLFQSVDGGQNWILVRGAPDQGAVTVAYSRISGRLYVSSLGDEAGLYISEDQGRTWTSAGIKGTLLAIAVSPFNPEHLIVINERGEVFASRDGGHSWGEDES